MSARSQSKKAVFARCARERRKIARIVRENSCKPGFIGVARGLQVTLPGGEKLYKDEVYSAVFLKHKEK